MPRWFALVLLILAVWICGFIIAGRLGGQTVARIEEKSILPADAEKLETIELASEAAFKRFEEAQKAYQKTIERLNPQYQEALKAAAKAVGIDPESKEWAYQGQRKKFVKQPPEPPVTSKK